MNLASMTVDIEVSIREAMERMNLAGSKTLFVVESDHFVGVLSDGDIRRAILGGADLNFSISEYVNRSPLVLSDSSKSNDIQSIMRRLSISFVPKLDSHGRLVGVISAEPISEKFLQKANVLIMAGGKGTRLSSLTKSIPKPLVQVANKPVIEAMVEKLASQGFRKFYVSVAYLSEKIMSVLGDGSNYGVEIEYISETSPLGTAGALKMVPKEKKYDTTIVCNADLILDLNFAELLQRHFESKSDITVLTTEFNYEIPFGVVKIEDNLVIEIIEKPIERYPVYAGVTVTGADLPGLIGDNEYVDMPSLIRRAIASGLIVGTYQMEGYWIDIGTVETLSRARRENQNSNPI